MIGYKGQFKSQQAAFDINDYVRWCLSLCVCVINVLLCQDEQAIFFSVVTHDTVLKFSINMASCQRMYPCSHLHSPNTITDTTQSCHWQTDSERHSSSVSHTRGGLNTSTPYPLTHQYHTSAWQLSCCCVVAKVCKWLSTVAVLVLGCFYVIGCFIMSRDILILDVTQVISVK